MSEQDRLSHARNVEGLHSEPSPLDRQEQSNPRFNQAAENRQLPDAQQGRNSGMIEKDGSRMHHRPSDELAKPQNQKDFDRAWTGEQRAAARIDQLRARYAAKPHSEGAGDQQTQNQRQGQKM